MINNEEFEGVMVMKEQIKSLLNALKDLSVKSWESMKKISKESFKKIKSALIAFIKIFYECSINLLSSLNKMLITFLASMDEMLAKGISAILKTIYEKIIKSISKW
jgi:hypothetical protein